MGLSAVMITTVVCAHLSQLRAQKFTSVIAYLLTVVASILFAVFVYQEFKDNKWTFKHSAASSAI